MVTLCVVRTPLPYPLWTSYVHVSLHSAFPFFAPLKTNTPFATDSVRCTTEATGSLGRLDSSSAPLALSSVVSTSSTVRLSFRLTLGLAVKGGDDGEGGGDVGRAFIFCLATFLALPAPLTLRRSRL